MPIESERVRSWTKKPLKFKGNVYPVCDDDGAAPRPFWVGAFVGARASGKTHTMCKLLKHYETRKMYDGETGALMGQRIILFSPTFDANPVWTTLKHLDAEKDVHGAYSDDKLREVVADIQAERDATLKYKEAMVVWNKFAAGKAEMSDVELLQLDASGFEPPEKPKYPNGCVTFLLLDDLVGSSALRNGKSALNYLAIRNRHLQICVGILVQSMKAIPKLLRSNTNLFAIWKFANKKMVLEDIYEEVSSCMTPAEFEELYDFCTEGEHNAMVIDFSQDKEKRFKKNFDEVVRVC